VSPIVVEQASEGLFCAFMDDDCFFLFGKLFVFFLFVSRLFHLPIKQSIRYSADSAGGTTLSRFRELE
jgi:hypothetical protein